MSGEIRILSIVRAVAEIAEENAMLQEHVRRVEAGNIKLQQEIEALRFQVQAGVAQSSESAVDSGGS